MSLFVTDQPDALGGGDYDEGGASGGLHQLTDPHIKADADFKEKSGVPHRNQVAGFRRIGMFVLVPAQKGCHMNVGPSDLLGKVFQNWNCDDDIQGFVRWTGPA